MFDDNYNQEKIRALKETRDNEIIRQFQKLVDAQEKILVSYRLQRNPGIAVDKAREAKAKLQKLGVL